MNIFQIVLKILINGVGKMICHQIYLGHARLNKITDFFLLTGYCSAFCAVFPKHILQQHGYFHFGEALDSSVYKGLGSKSNWEPFEVYSDPGSALVYLIYTKILEEFYIQIEILMVELKICGWW